MTTVTSYLGIGSNLGDRKSNIKASIRYLQSNNRIHVQKISPIYEMLACGGPKNQPEYLNSTVKIQTSLIPLDLLSELQDIEKKLKRKKSVHWGPRTIDLDILFYGNLVYASRGLTIPHVLSHKRFFVLKPLSDIAPKFVHPLLKKRIKDLLKRFKKVAYNN